MKTEKGRKNRNSFLPVGQPLLSAIHSYPRALKMQSDGWPGIDSPRKTGGYSQKYPYLNMDGIKVAHVRTGTSD